jgi:hypothetical protein
MGYKFKGLRVQCLVFSVKCLVFRAWGFGDLG